MSQHDYVLDNAIGSNFRVDLNTALGAIATNNSGAIAPVTTYAYQWWADTTTGLLKRRNSTNTAWVTIMSLDSLTFASPTCTGTTQVAALNASGLATLDGGIKQSAALPYLWMVESDQAADQKGWITRINGSNYQIVVVTDAGAAVTLAADVTRSGAWTVGSLTSAGAITSTNGVYSVAPPVTETGATHTIAVSTTYLIANRAGTITVTLPSAATYPGRVLTIKTIQAQTVVSNASNVVPQIGGAAGTAILAATDGKWATLVSDGTNWEIMASN